MIVLGDAPRLQEGEGKGYVQEERRGTRRTIHVKSLSKLVHHRTVRVLLFFQCIRPSFSILLYFFKFPVLQDWRLC